MDSTAVGEEALVFLSGHLPWKSNQSVGLSEYLLVVPWSPNYEVLLLPVPITVLIKTDKSFLRQKFEERASEYS